MTTKELAKKVYGYACDNDREAMLEMAMRDLWRNYPEFPSTFGPCHNPDCDGGGRGGGLCRKCVTECLGVIVRSDALALKFRMAIEAVRDARTALRKTVERKS